MLSYRGVGTGHLRLLRAVYSVIYLFPVDITQAWSPDIRCHTSHKYAQYEHVPVFAVHVTHVLNGKFRAQHYFSHPTKPCAVNVKPSWPHPTISFKTYYVKLQEKDTKLFYTWWSWKALRKKLLSLCPCLCIKLHECYISFEHKYENFILNISCSWTLSHFLS